MRLLPGLPVDIRLHKYPATKDQHSLNGYFITVTRETSAGQFSQQETCFTEKETSGQGFIFFTRNLLHGQRNLRTGGQFPYRKLDSLRKKPPDRGSVSLQETFTFHQLSIRIVGYPMPINPPLKGQSHEINLRYGLFGLNGQKKFF